MHPRPWQFFLPLELPGLGEYPLRGMPPHAAAPPPLVEALATRKMRVIPSEVVFVKGVIEASEGLAVVFAESGGDLTIATPPCRVQELDRLLEDLRVETGALLEIEEHE